MKLYTEDQLSAMSVDEIYENLRKGGESKEAFFNRLGFEYKEPDGLLKGMGKSLVQGMTAFPKTVYGVGAVMEDLAYKAMGGSDEYKDLSEGGLFRHEYEKAKEVEARFQPNTDGWKYYINEAVKTIAQMGSHAVGTAGLGSLPSMATGAGVDKYLEARKEGTEVLPSLSAGATQSIVEYATELPFFRIIKEPGIKFLSRLGRGLVADVPGELIATLSEMKLVDEMTLGKSYTMEEYTKALLDTMIVSGLTTAGVTAAVHPYTTGQTQQQKDYEKFKDRPKITEPGKTEIPGEEITPEAQQVSTQRYVLETNLPKNTIVGGSKEIGDVYDYVINNKSNKLQAVRYQTVNQDEAIKLKESTGGLEFEGYHHTINNYGIRHALSGHGDSEIESERGQIAITKEDIQNIPQIINSYDKIELSEEKDSTGNDVLRYTKKINGEIYYLEEVRNKRHELTIKSMWKTGTPEASDASSQIPKISEKSPAHTSKANSGNPTNSIQPTGENIKSSSPENLSPKLNPLIESGELSMKDAKDITSLGLTPDQQEYFYYNLIKPNQAMLIDKDQAKLRLQYTAYKKMQDVLRLGKGNEKMIEVLQNQIDKIATNLKIEGGAPDKFEMILDNILTAYKDMKPEELIKKVQEELALNLNRIDAGIDTKTLMAATLKAFNETKGREKETISHEQTKQEALKELPTIYGKVMRLKPDKTLTRPQQLAARILGNTLTDILNKSKVLGRQDPTNQALYQQTVRQFLELGQYLSKVAQSSSEMGRELEAQKIIAEYGRDIPNIDEIIKAAEQVKNGMSPEKFYRMLDELKTNGQIQDAVEGLARNPSMFIEYWINALLSNPMTQTTNILSQIYTTFAGPTERALAARLHFEKNTGVVLGEAQAMLFGLQTGFMDALRLAGKSLRSGEPQFGTQKVENYRQKAITAENLNAHLRWFGIESELIGSLARGFNMLGEVVRIPTRLLMSMDDFFKAINYRMEAYAQAYRQVSTEGITDKVELGKRISEIVNNPTPEIKSMAENFAREQTFTMEPTIVGKSLASVVNATRYGRIILPFISTPESIFRYTARRLPVLNLISQQTRADLAGGGAARDLALGKMALGGIIASSIAMLAVNGLITGGGPDDKELKQMLYAKGWQPYAIKIGDTYYSYKRIDPIGSLFGLVADFTEVAGELDEKNLQSLATTIILSMSSNIVSKTYLTGITNILEAIQAPNKRWHEYMKKQVGSLIPAGSAMLARMDDPTLKETETLMDAMRARIPGYARSLPPRRNIFGDPVLLEGGLGPDAISPIYTSSEKHDPVVDEIVKQGVQLSMPSRFLGGSSFSQTDPITKETPIHGIPLELEQYDKLVRYTGEGLKEDLAELFDRESYQNASDGPYGGKALKILNIVDKHKERARDRLLKEDTDLADRVKEKKLLRRQLRQPMTPEPMSSNTY